MTGIRGRLLTPIGADPRPEDLLACAVCREPTDVRMLTPGRPDIGEVACHAGCAAFLVALVRRRAAARPAGRHGSGAIVGRVAPAQ